MADESGDKPPRKPGRPKSPEPGARVTAWVSASTYARLVRQSLKSDQSLSSILREALRDKPPR